EVLFRAGETSDCGYIVQDGQFVLTSEAKSAGEGGAGPGTLLRGLPLIAEAQRPATATARPPSTGNPILRSLFLKMLEGYPEAAHILRDQIVHRAQQALTEITDVRGRLDTSEGPQGEPSTKS